ncbi:glycoside hydrolase family 16 protein [Deinococcus marmoris]|uniref:Secreted hydrolase n=1 Tax=Deinococcus marmoris TaxID=249408 RepID=A0A1U7NT43_9DEIO|nr:glycoside hydrolase family 16 protein [Deinococcus marmoris]OLV16094.1 secreted hydrolase [Deinococcus marmoris]
MNIPRKNRAALTLGLICALSVSCAAWATQPLSSAALPIPATPPDPRWTLIWQDEFGGAAGSQPDERIWNYDYGNADANGWGNEELQFYTRDVANVRLDGQGHLEIRALKNTADLACWNGDPCAYTSARLTTKNKVTFTNGRIEARIQMPPGAGYWPAFWSLGQNGKWPDGGEIDIMEWLGREPNTVYGTLHGPGYSGAQGISKNKTLGRAASDGYHTFAIIKRPREIVWLLDGVPYHRVTPDDLPADRAWVFGQPFYLLLNLAVGGQWPGPPNASTVFPGVMNVDYVRVWQENATP